MIWRLRSKLTDRYIEKVDEAVAGKEKELMEI